MNGKGKQADRNTVDHYLDNNKFHIIFDIFGKHQQLNIRVYDIYFRPSPSSGLKQLIDDKSDWEIWIMVEWCCNRSYDTWDLHDDHSWKIFKHSQALWLEVRVEVTQSQPLMFIYYPSCYNHITETRDLWFPSLTDLLLLTQASAWITRYRFQEKRNFHQFCVESSKCLQNWWCHLAKIIQKIFIFLNPTKLIRITLRLLSVLWAHITWFRFAQRLQFITVEHTHKKFLEKVQTY